MKSFFNIGLLVIFMSCAEFQTTQNELNLSLNRTNIPADGISIVEITLKLDNALASYQDVTFYTTDGDLFESPNSDLKVDGVKELTFKPSIIKNGNDLNVKAYLRSDRMPKDSVIISAEINGLYSQVHVNFTRNPISSIVITVDKDSLTLNPVDEINLEIILLSDKGLPSLGDFLLQEITSNDTISLDNLLFYDKVLSINNDTITTIIKPRVLSFSDTTLTRVLGHIAIADTVFGASASERINIIKP